MLLLFQARKRCILTLTWWWCCCCSVAMLGLVTAQTTSSSSSASPSSSSLRVLQQVHVITRHGARYPLVKNDDTLAEATDGTLTPAGIRQEYDLGVWLHHYYQAKKERQEQEQEQQASTTTRSAVVRFLPHYSRHQVWVESSSLDRTIASARALTAGLYENDTTTQRNEIPAEVPFPIVPVYTVPPEHDIYIRAYDKCDAYHDHYLTQLYDSAKWKQVEQQHVDLLVRLATIPAFEEYVEENAANVDGGKIMVPLTQIWNVYDAIHVAKFECGDHGSGSTVNDTPSIICQQRLVDASLATVVSKDDWQVIEQLAHISESLKYYSPEAGKYVGSNLLSKIFKRMQQHSNQTVNKAMETEDGSGSFYLYSAHYPTLLGVLAALQGPDWKGLDVSDLEEEGATGSSTSSLLVYERETVPNYASAVVLELYQDPVTLEQTVQIYYRIGDALNTSSLLHPLYGVQHPVRLLHNQTFCFRGPDGDEADDENNNHCTLNEIWAGTIGHDWTVEQWCTLCNNTEADVCMQQALRDIQQQPATALATTPPQPQQSPSHDETDNDHDHGRSLALGVIVSLLVGMLLGWLLPCRGNDDVAGRQAGRTFYPNDNHNHNHNNNKADDSSVAAADVIQNNHEEEEEYDPFATHTNVVPDVIA